jgi:hypothetical protein
MMIPNSSVGRDRRGVFQRDAFTFAEQREKNQRYESKALQDDRNGYGTLLDVAGALFGLRIAFNEATAKGTEFIFGRTGHTLDIQSHHTPPGNSCEPWDFAAPASGGCVPETSTVLAGM